MKFTKSLALILAVVTILSMVSCGRSDRKDLGEYDSYYGKGKVMLYASADGSTEAGSISEKIEKYAPKLPKTITRKDIDESMNVPEEFTVTIDGETYTGSLSSYDGDNVISYSSPDAELSFSIFKDSKKIKGYTFIRYFNGSTFKGKTAEFTADGLKDAAREAAGKMIDVQLCTEKIESNESNVIFSYIYTVSGIETMQYSTFVFSRYDGKLYSVNVTGSDDLYSESTILSHGIDPDKIDTEKISSEVVRSVEEDLAAQGKNVSLKAADVYLGYLEEGSYCIIVRLEKSDGGEFGEFVYIL